MLFFCSICFLLPLAPQQLLSAPLIVFQNLKGGAWRQKLGSSAGAEKFGAISGRRVFTGRLLIALKEKPQNVVEPGGREPVKLQVAT